MSGTHFKLNTKLAYLLLPANLSPPSFFNISIYSVPQKLKEPPLYTNDYQIQYATNVFEFYFQILLTATVSKMAHFAHLLLLLVAASAILSLNETLKFTFLLQ
jgi:hypothetical protein